MALTFITKEHIADFFTRVDRSFGREGQLLFIGETTQVLEGWRRFTDEIEFCSIVDAADREAFNEAVINTAFAMGLRATDEFPGEVIPLPDGYDDRHRPLSDGTGLKDMGLSCSHFDPYAVSFRFIARGGETDYQLVVRYLENGWIDWDEMTERLEGLLPEFTFETIQQDPAEFRRRYGGLFQMWEQRRRRLLETSPERSMTG